jgi:hypothetical protein
MRQPMELDKDKNEFVNRLGEQRYAREVIL